MELKKRKKWMDVAKGIALFMVLLGHGMRDTMRVNNAGLDYVYRVCYVFHMSFFFFLSGYSLKNSMERYNYDKVKMANKKIRALVFPWIAYTLFIYVVFNTALVIPGIKKILNGSGYEKKALSAYLIEALQANNEWAYHLWFLLVLFIISILFILLSAKKGKGQLGIWIIIAASLFTVGYGYYDFLGDWNDLFFHLAVYIPYFGIGYAIQLGKYVEINNQKRSRMKGLELLGVAYILIRAKWFSGFNGNNIAGDIKLVRVTVAYLGYILMPFAMILLCQMSNIFSEKTRLLMDKFAWLGENSFNVYLWHQPFCCAFCGVVLYDKLGVPAIVTIGVCITLSIIVGWIITQLKQIMSNSILKIREST